MATERNTKLVLNFALGRRTQATTDAFIEGLRHAAAPQLFQTSKDGFKPYLSSIQTTLGDRCDFVQLIKVYAENNVLATAKRDSVALPLSLAQDGGEKYVEAAKNSPTVWGAALDLVSYRTILNAGSAPSGESRILPPDKSWSYGAPMQQVTVSGKPQPTLLFSLLGVSVRRGCTPRFNRKRRERWTPEWSVVSYHAWRRLPYR